MAKTFLTSDELLLMSTWFKYIFFPTLKQDRNTVRDHATRPYLIDTNEVKLLYDTIVDCKYNDCDSILKNLAQSNLIDDAHNEHKLSAQLIAAFLANMCRLQEIWWDDLSHTTQENIYFKNTILGKALDNFKCFVSQETVTPSNSSKAPAQKQASTATGSTTSYGSRLFRNTAPGIDQNSQKVQATDSVVYWLRGDFSPAKANKAKVHVSPLGQQAPLRVKYSSGQGFDDCVLFFFTVTDAQDFLKKCLPNCPATVINLSVFKTAADANGYISVDTEYGPAYIKASKLHENLVDEDLDLDCCEDKKSNFVFTTDEEYNTYMTEACERLDKLMN